ncbi:MAG: RNA methyltransferase [Myxococcota bacterium]
MEPNRIRIVLLRTQFGANLGASARALHNFGLSRLVLAALGNVVWNDVNQMAVRSRHLVEGAERVASLEAALDGCAYVVGTTMRSLPGRRSLDPRAAAETLARRSSVEDVALVFGEERIGLTNADLLACHDTSVIPTFGLESLNLAQAVLLYAWELSQWRHPPPAGPASPAATERDYAVIARLFRARLTADGFADPDRPRHGVGDLMQTLKRARLTPREARLWQAALSAGAARDS